MALDLDLPASFEAWRDDAMERAIQPDEGLKVLARAVQSGLPHVFVSTRDLTARRLADSRAHAAAQEQLATEEGTFPQRHARPPLSTVYQEPESATQQAVASIWQELLGVDQIGLADNFFELGGHSLLAIQVISRVRSAFQMEMSAHTLFEHPTVGALSQQIEEWSRPSEGHDELIRMLEHVEQLPRDQVLSLLASNGDGL
jgi:acyl carrier protein